MIDNKQAEVKEEVKEENIVTPNILGKELNLRPTEVRRLLRKRFDRKGKTWGWDETDPELDKVKNYLSKQIIEIAEEKEKKKLEREKAKAEKERLAQQVIQETLDSVNEDIEVLATNTGGTDKQNNPFDDVAL